MFLPNTRYAALPLSLVGLFLMGCVWEDTDPTAVTTGVGGAGSSTCNGNCNANTSRGGGAQSLDANTPTSGGSAASGTTAKNATSNTGSDESSSEGGGNPQTSTGPGNVTANGVGGAASNATNATTSSSTGGTTGSATSTGPKVCTDTPRPSESCTNAVQWGFCGQAWFAGNCEASCGVCTLGTGGSRNQTAGVGGASTSGNATSATGGARSVGGASTSGNTSSATGGVRSAGGSSARSTGGSSSTASGNAPARVDNPYVSVKGYINPEWSAKAEAEPGGSRISKSPTGVWLDRIAAIAGSSSSMGLRDHLDEAIAQGAGYAQFIIYNLPGRDCAALSSNGELGPTEIDRYKTEYIDPIVDIMSDAKYAALRIINIIEIDSLPNLVTNTGSSKTATATCDTMKANGNYQKGVQYALSKLHALPNTYNYVDGGHHGWIGWDTNMSDSVALFAATVKEADGGFATVQGFITNTANYSALTEPYLTVTEDTRQSKWIDWNRYVDELTFAKAMRTKLVAAGFDSSIGMIIDTSRNGWGGPNRPKAASTSSDIDTKINDSRVDRRIHMGNWCNQSGAGLGERPQSVNADGIDAYVWIKPPGESDGASSEIANDQGKGFDRMCDPTYGGNARNGNSASGALGDAPLSGAWFSSQFQELMTNAYPAL